MTGIATARASPIKRFTQRLVTRISSVFIPVAHFLLVPSFALFGVYTFFERLSTREVVLAAQGVCPDCGKPQQLDISGRWHLPRRVACRHCQRPLQIS